MIKYLATVYDSRASFGHKAIVETCADSGDVMLTSYLRDVARIRDGKLELMEAWDSSQTTLRHVKEFARQNGFIADSLRQMRRDYER